MQEILEKFKDVNVLVVGDVMLDQYWWGNVDRISPEAPVPVVALKEKSLVAGGAANVAANVIGLGAKPYLVGVVGNDQEAIDLSRCLDQMGISDEFLIQSESRSTIVKTRVVANNQQIVRVDRETSFDLGATTEQAVLERIENLADSVDVILVSDYAKGVITERLVTKIIKKAKESNKKVLVDPKGKDYSKYRSADILTPNQKEALEAAGLESDSEESLRDAGNELVSKFELGHLLITQGEKGMTLFSKDLEPQHLETVARRVYDVTGAGDTVIATIAVALGAGADFFQACDLANLAAGKVVEHVGTTPILVDNLLVEPE